MPEEWRPVVGYEGLYEVSNMGRVRSLDRKLKGPCGTVETHRGQVLKEQALKNGYREVHVCRDGKRKHRTVHSLVAEAFLGERPDKHDILHLDGDRSNNAANNLRYDTRAENLHSTYAYGGKQANGKLSLGDVDSIRRELHSGCGARDIAKQFGVDSAAIYHIRDGKSFAWYKPEEVSSAR